MSAFPLLESAPRLVERIIAKTDYKSNFRLRQTCHTVNDFIRISRNIIAPVWEEFDVQFAESTVKLSRKPFDPSRIIDLENYYGTRLGTLYLPGEMDEEKYNLLHEILKKYKITCYSVHNTCCYTAEQCDAQFKLLKPIEVLFGQPYNPPWKHVSAGIPEDDIILMISSFLSNFSKIEVEAYPVANRFELLHNVLNEFMAQASSKLKEFHLRFIVDETATKEELDAEFPDLQWKDFPFEQEHIAYVELPPHFPQNYYCSVFVGKCIDNPCVEYSIYYGKT